MSVPAMRTSLPNTIIQSWRTSLTKQRGSQPVQSLRSFFSTNSCLSASSPVSSSSSRILSSLRQGGSTSSFLANTPHHHHHSFSTSSTPSSSFTASPFKTLFTSSHRLTYVQQVFKHGRQNTRNFSLSGIWKAGRPHWYTDSNNQTNLYRAPTVIGRVRRYIDTRIPKVSHSCFLRSERLLYFVCWGRS